MNEIYEQKKSDIVYSKDKGEEGMDLMGAMIRTSGQIPGTANHGKPEAGLTKEEILGNSFILFLAGHETAANSIHFAMIYLAMNPSFQRELQGMSQETRCQSKVNGNAAELDQIFKARDSSEWDYDNDLPKLFGGLVGAVMNEELRLVPPIVTIFKCTLPDSPQHLTVNGKEVTIPADCTVALHAVGAHRHPKFWPHGKPQSKSKAETDLDEFRPDRWFEKPGPDIIHADTPATPQNFTSLSSDGLGVDESPDTASSMFRPARGAYVPFSEGARACLGRRFAQVEILAALSVIFTRYSVELGVEEWATEEEVLEMSESERRNVWGKAKEEVHRKMQDEMGSIITIQLRGKPVQIRICERGSELFDWKDE
jgi:cytochrome P450